ncbi:putative transcriptional regulator [Nocardia farcinica IFM 10152]|uniref:Putative transcriptional regulator n=1 Tax=Nocardia farcinica (strain IFM 10152) TaxID=247156 RepID=Q5YWV3_NOCFA|nr:putative transcriptional regulator [Nocardia farcinica IFM 10152]
MQQELSLETSKRPGGRSARVRAAVRQATLDELVAHGYAGLTIDNVAQRSGVHKTTVYRRWGSPAGLVADALELAAEEAWPLPDTGDLTADLRALTAAVHTGFTDPDAGPVATAFVTAALQNPDAATALRAFYRARHHQSAEIVRRAVARGELGPEVDPEAVVRYAIAPVFHRLLITHEPVDETLTRHAADTAIAAARAGLLDRAPGRS